MSTFRCDACGELLPSDVELEIHKRTLKHQTCGVLAPPSASQLLFCSRPACHTGPHFHPEAGRWTNEKSVKPPVKVPSEPAAPLSSILSEAAALISGPRRESYGSYDEESKRIAAGWSVLVGAQVDPRAVPLMMAWLKMVRETHKPERDNRADAIGYLALLDEIEQAKAPLSVEEAQRRRVCRICKLTDVPTPGNPLVLNFGEEFAHQKCIEQAKVLKDALSKQYCAADKKSSP